MHVVIIVVALIPHCGLCYIIIIIIIIIIPVCHLSSVSVSYHERL